jgi:hypothetical protein
VIAAVARAGGLRLARTRLGWIACAGWCAVAIVAALLARHDRAFHGADRVLLGAYASVVLPLSAFAVVGALVGAGPLSAAIEPFARFGAPRGRSTWGIAGVAAIACMVLGAALAAAVALLAHGELDPPRARDALTSAYAGALGGAAYAAWFVLGAGFGRRGGGRATLLVIDWVLGTGQGTAALFTPRAHLRNLLGGVAPLELAPRVSALALVAIALACAAIAAWRAGRRT